MRKSSTEFNNNESVLITTAVFQIIFMIMIIYIRFIYSILDFVFAVKTLHGWQNAKYIL